MSQSSELQRRSHDSVTADGNDGHVARDGSDATLDDDPPPYAKPRLHWWNVKAWSKKNLLVVLALSLTAIIIIVVVVPVEVEKKKNEYPHYSKLNYSLVDSYAGTDFFDNFEYLGGLIGFLPLGGFIPNDGPPKVNRPDGQQNCTYASSSSANLTVNPTADYDTVEIISKKQYSHGLFVFDILHLPIGCSTWPAIRLADPYNWPAHGEISVLSAIQIVNDGSNQPSLHTTAGCNMNVKRKQSSQSLSTTCTNSDIGEYEEGCIVDAGPETYGATLNFNGGVLMAVELRNEGIRIWQFSRSSIPSDISNGTPDPSTWPEATADFPSTHCDIGTHFQNQSIVVDIAVCGAWASNAVNEDICETYCHRAPGEDEDDPYYKAPHKDAYWEIKAITVYEGA